MTNRRGFLGALAALVAARFLPAIAPAAAPKFQEFVVTDAWPSGGLLQKGDVFTINGTYSVYTPPRIVPSHWPMNDRHLNRRAAC